MSLGDLLERARKPLDAGVAKAADPAWVDAAAARLRTLRLAYAPAGHAAVALAGVLEEERAAVARVGHATLVDLVNAHDLGDVEGARLALLRSRAPLAERLAAMDAASKDTRDAVESDREARALAERILVAAGRFATGLLLR